MVAGLLLAMSLCAGEPSLARSATALTPRQVLDIWEKDPRLGPFTRKVEVAFPEEVLEIAQSFLAKQRSGASERQLRAFVDAQTEALMDSHRYLLATAPDEKLVRYVTAAEQSEVILQSKDPALCAHPNDVTTENAGTFLALPQIDALLDAMTSGRDTPVQRAPASPTDFDAYRQSFLHLQVSKEVLDAAQNPKAPRDDKTQCELLIALLKAYEPLPPDVLGRLIGASVGTPPAK